MIVRTYLYTRVVHPRRDETTSRRARLLVSRPREQGLAQRRVASFANRRELLPPRLHRPRARVARASSRRRRRRKRRLLAEVDAASASFRRRFASGGGRCGSLRPAPRRLQPRVASAQALAREPRGVRAAPRAAPRRGAPGRRRERRVAGKKTKTPSRRIRIRRGGRLRRRTRRRTTRFGRSFGRPVQNALVPFLLVLVLGPLLVRPSRGGEDAAAVSRVGEELPKRNVVVVGGGGGGGRGVDSGSRRRRRVGGGRWLLRARGDAPREQVADVPRDVRDGGPAAGAVGLPDLGPDALARDASRRRGAIDRLDEEQERVLARGGRGRGRGRSVRRRRGGGVVPRRGAPRRDARRASSRSRASSRDLAYAKKLRNSGASRNARISFVCAATCRCRSRVVPHTPRASEPARDMIPSTDRSARGGECGRATSRDRHETHNLRSLVCCRERGAKIECRPTRGLRPSQHPRA